MGIVVYRGCKFDARSQFLWPNGGWDKHFIFEVDNSSSTDADNNKKRCLSSWLRSKTKIK